MNCWESHEIPLGQLFSLHSLPFSSGPAKLPGDVYVSACTPTYPNLSQGRFLIDWRGKPRKHHLILFPYCPITPGQVHKNVTISNNVFTPQQSAITAWAVDVSQKLLTGTKQLRSPDRSSLLDFALGVYGHGEHGQLQQRHRHAGAHHNHQHRQHQHCRHQMLQQQQSHQLPHWHASERGHATSLLKCILGFALVGFRTFRFRARQKHFYLECILWIGTNLLEPASLQACRNV